MKAAAQWPTAAGWPSQALEREKKGSVALITFSTGCSGRTAVRWVKLVRKYRKIMAKVYADPAKDSYTDHALEPPAGHNAPMSDFVRTYADKIPNTHGAPVREAALN